MGEDTYDVPWEYTRRSNPAASRASLATPAFEREYKKSTRRSEHPSRCHSIQEKRVPDEDWVEWNVDRVQAEKRLEARAAGDFLLRWRSEGSAALSLKSAEGVLHLKIERCNERWIVGEGAKFRSISSAIYYYRQHPLPIRGSPHICLKECISLSKG